MSDRRIPELTELDIKDGDVVAVDLETYDPELKTHGSGAIRGKGKVCGIAVAYRDEKYYFPIAHLHSGQNVGKNKTWRKLNNIIFQNLNHRNLLKLLLGIEKYPLLNNRNIYSI